MNIFKMSPSKVRTQRQLVASAAKLQLPLIVRLSVRKISDLPEGQSLAVERRVGPPEGPMHCNGPIRFW